jgi:hypothetical protein
MASSSSLTPLQDTVAILIPDSYCCAYKGYWIVMGVTMLDLMTEAAVHNACNNGYAEPKSNNKFIVAIPETISRLWRR